MSLTVTVNKHEAERPASSDTVQLTVVVPFGNADPDAGVHTGAPAPEQLSLTPGEKFTTALQALGSVLWVMFAGQLIVGFTASFTVTVNEQAAVRPAPSVTVQLTDVVPLGKATPEAGVQTTAPCPSGQLSVAVGSNVTTAVQAPASVLPVIFAGQVIDGGWLSFTVTVNEQEAVRPAASVNVQLTVVVPFGKAVPGVGAQVGVPTPGQLSLAAGAKVTTAEHWSGSVLTVIGLGQVRLGG